MLPVDIDAGVDQLVQRVSVAEAGGLPQLLLHDERRRRLRDQRRAQLPRGEHDLRRGRQLSGRYLEVVAVESLFKCSRTMLIGEADLRLSLARFLSPFLLRSAVGSEDELKSNRYSRPPALLLGLR